jgi:cysteine desulfurase / selenocysteine lyase
MIIVVLVIDIIFFNRLIKTKSNGVKMIYLDNAATSWPKPPEVLKAITEVMEQAGGNPGRSGHRFSVAAARVVYECREKVTEFFNISDPKRVIFTANATQAINLVLRGILKPGDHVVTSSMEHNAVMRPLRFLEKQGIVIKIAQCAADGTLDVSEIAKLIDNKTRLVVISLASNVTGTILPVAEVTAVAHQFGALVLADAAQAAGAIPIDLRQNGVDFLAFTGHKELLGPTGIGGLIISQNVDARTITPLMFGGTGSRSDSEEQPEDMPDKFESGTANMIGIAGLRAALGWINQRGLAAIGEHNKELTMMLLEGLANINGVKIYGTPNAGNSLAIVSFTIKGKKVSEVGFRLDDEFEIMARVGLHCAPAAHRTIGSFPEGTVRFSPGIFTTTENVKQTLKAVQKVTRS